MKRTAWKVILCFAICGIVLMILGALILLIPNTYKTDQPLLILKDSSYENVLQSISDQQMVKNVTTFQIASKLLDYNKIRSGRYTFEDGDNNFTIVMKLRRGQHYPVKFTFNNVRTKEQFIEKVGNKFLFTPLDLETVLNDEQFLLSYQLTSENCISIFIPDSYEFYYDITAYEFFEKMAAYYNQFWNNERLAQAEAIGLTPVEVGTLASIVEEENYKEDEKARIAGLYINRLAINMELQADPTVKFAVGNFSLKRIYEHHTQVDSPYNTYLYKGLPPGPIRIPERSTLDAVLHYEHHNYLYMCAKDDFSGYHNFTDSYTQHLINAQRYQQALNRQQKK